MPFTLRDLKDVFLFPFLESISLMVFQLFLISDTLSKVYAIFFYLAAHMFVRNVSCSLEAGLVNLTLSYIYIPKSH